MVAALLDAASMREIMASQRTAFVKFDFGPKCKDCIELNPVWHALARETLPGLMVRATDQANEFDIHWYERNPDYDKYEQTFLLNVEVRRATVVTRAAAGPLGMRLLRA